MDATKRKALEAGGWKIGDAADFLEMSDEERQLLDARVSLALAIRQQRESLELGTGKICWSRPRPRRVRQMQVGYNSRYGNKSGQTQQLGALCHDAVESRTGGREPWKRTIAART